MDDNALYLNVRQRSVLLAHWHLLHCIQHLETVDHLAEDGVLVVQMRLDAVGDVELRPVRIWTIIRKGQYTSFI